MDADTEYLSVHGWRRIADYKSNELIGAYDMDMGRMAFVMPLMYHVEKCDRMLRFSNARSDIVLSERDRMVVKHVADGKVKHMNPLYLEGLVSRGPYRHVTTFRHENPYRACHDDNMLRLHVLFKRHGTVRCSGVRHGARIHVVVTKDTRVIERFVSMLLACGLEYRLLDNYRSTGLTRLEMHIPGVTRDWMWPYSWVSEADAQVIFDETFRLCRDHGLMTVSRINAEFLQFVGAMLGWRSGCELVEKKSSWPGAHRIWRLNFSRAINPRVGGCSDYLSHNGLTYNFTTASGAWVSRRNGHITIVGGINHGAY